MKYMKKWIAIMLAMLMMFASLPVQAQQADGSQDVKSVEGAFAAVSSTQLFLVLPDQYGSSLYSMPVGGGSLTLIDSATQIDEVICVDDVIYYLSYTGAAFNVNSRAANGVRTILTTFASPQVAHSLTYYNGALYCLVDSKLTRIGIQSGEVTTLSQRLMEDYCIADEIVYYQSAEDQASYIKDSLINTGSTFTQQAGRLYQMRLDGTGDTVLFSEGVAALKAYGDNVYFHNMGQSYIVQTTDQEWMDGLLYRINVLTGQLVVVSSSYDWDYKPTASGMVIYRQNQISITGMDGVESTLYTPDLYSYVALLDNCAIVYEYNLQKLSLIPLDGTGAVLLHEGAFIATGSELGNQTATTQPTTGDTTANTGNTTTGQTGSTAANNSTGSLMLGATGERVKEMQKRLVELGYLASADGDFGNKTLAAVKAFQKAAGLTVDGIAGEKTLAALNRSDAPKADKIATATDSSYIFPNSSKKKLTREEILKVDESLWAYARNEIYARHGYSFSNATYRKYFENKTWYTEGGFSTKDLNEIEWYNMELLRSMEEEYESESGSSSGSSGSSSSYIFPNSSTKKLTKDEIRAVDEDLWAYGRNEILARHGYSFTKKKYADYFASKSWYKAGGYSSSDLNEIEWYNMDLIKWMEDNEG